MYNNRTRYFPTLTLMLTFFIPIICIRLYYHYPPKNSSDCTIVIDVGHGGNDPGKVSNSGTEEKQINLQIATSLKNQLSEKGFHVFLTRESDSNLSDPLASNQKRSDLNNRILFFQKHKADLVISIHQNSYTDPSIHGAQTFYQTGNSKSKLLATCLQNQLTLLDPTNKRLAKESDSYFILKNCNAPIVLIECGFLSNPNEEALLISSQYQSQISTAITNGISDYMTKSNVTVTP